MISNYDEYLKQNNHLSFEEMQTIHKKIISSIANDEDALEIYEELLSSSFKYAKMRMDWEIFTREKKMDSDSLRTSYHESVITKFNMLSRYLKMQNKDTSWYDDIGTIEENPTNRQRIGDMACYLSFVCSINNR
jgi:hypothetical protein